MRRKTERSEMRKTFVSGRVRRRALSATLFATGGIECGKEADPARQCFDDGHWLMTTWRASFRGMSTHRPQSSLRGRGLCIDKG